MGNKLSLETPTETIERCEKHGATWLGDRVEFKPAGVDASRAVAKNVFGRHGFADFIETAPRPETVLKASAKRGSQPKGYMTRPFVSPNPDTPLAIHVTRVTGNDESGDDYECLARIRIGKRHDPVAATIVPFAVARPPEGLTKFSNETAKTRALWIANHANHVLAHVENAHVGDGLRKALESIGCVKSLGGGNNYYVPAPIAERVHNFLADVRDHLGIYYLRDPKTTMGAGHTQNVMAQAAQQSLADDLQAMQAELDHAVNAANNPTLTKKGKNRSREATLTKQLERMGALRAKMQLYDGIIQKRVLGPMAQLHTKYEQFFEALKGGGTVLWDDSTKGDIATVAGVEPKAAPVRKPKKKSAAAPAPVESEAGDEAGAEPVPSTQPSPESADIKDHPVYSEQPAQAFGDPPPAPAAVLVDDDAFGWLH